MSRNRVYMVGPSLHTQGGISSVLAIYKNQLTSLADMAFIPSYSGKNRLFDLYYFCTAFARILFICLLEEDPVFHIHTSTGGSYIRKSILTRLCKLFGKKVLLHLHGADFDAYIEEAGPSAKKRIIRLLNRADALIALSETWKTYFSQYIAPEKIHVVYNPCAAAVDAYKSRQNPRVNVLFTGRLGRRKGTYDLLEALRKIKSNGYILSLYGDGDTEIIRELAKEQGLEDLVSVSGWVPHASIFPLYRNADIFVLPSYAEGLPMSVLEAMGAGLPVISTEVGGIPEAVEDGVNGFLIKPGDIDSLAEKLELLINDAALRVKMGKASLLLAKEKFSAAKIGMQLAEIYDKLRSESETINS